MCYRLIASSISPSQASVRVLLHRIRRARSCESDLWQQWQALASQFANPASPAHRPSSATALFIDSAERFRRRGAKISRRRGECVLRRRPMRCCNSAIFCVNSLPTCSRCGRRALASAPAVPRPGSPAASAMNSPALGATREHQQRGRAHARCRRRALDAQRRLQRLWADALARSRDRLHHTARNSCSRAPSRRRCAAQAL